MARDLVGYGRTPPPVEWPDGARVAVNVVLVYEEGSEYSVLWGDDRNDGWGEYAGAGVQPPQRDLGTETHYDYGARAGVWRLARILGERPLGWNSRSRPSENTRELLVEAGFLYDSVRATSSTR